MPRREPAEWYVRVLIAMMIAAIVALACLRAENRDLERELNNKPPMCTVNSDGIPLSVCPEEAAEP